MRNVSFIDKLLHEIVGNEDKVLESAKELAKHLDLDIFSTALKDLPFYKEYLRFFDINGLIIQKPLFIETFDLDLLIKLIVASHSSTYDFTLAKDGNIRLVIYVNIASKSAKKYFDDLDVLQIARMYSIYLDELINLENLQYDKDVEKDILLARRRELLESFYEKKAKALRMEFYSFLQRGN